MGLESSLSVEATSRLIEINGVELHVVEAGPMDGGLLILLHGFPDFWWGWRHQIEPLTKAGFRVVIPDQRGYNLSSKPKGVHAYHIENLAADITALADSYNAKTFHLVGHDWGGVVAWWVAVRYPRRVQKLAILNAPHPDVFPRLLWRRWRQMLKSFYVAFFQLPLLPEIVLRSGRFACLYEVAMRRALTPAAPTGTFSETDRDVYIQAWSHKGSLTAMLNYYRSLARKPWKRPARITPPTLVLWGKHDVALELEVATASLKLCNQGQSCFLEAGHWLQLEKAEVVSAELTRFFLSQ